jgi:hypothetical protein
VDDVLQLFLVAFPSKYIPTLHLYTKKARAKEVDLVPFTAYLCDELSVMRTEKNLAATAFFSTAVSPPCPTLSDELYVTYANISVDVLISLDLRLPTDE